MIQVSEQLQAEGKGADDKAPKSYDVTNL